MRAAPLTPEFARLDFDDVYRDHVGFVWRNLRRFGVAEAELEDVAHEVFLVVHRRLPEFDGRSAVTTWLYVIARGVACNRRRSERRRLRRLEHVPELPPPPDPGDHVARSEAAAAVERFLVTLTPEQRAAFELCDIEGMRAGEVGEVLGVNINTVYTRLRAARLRFNEFVAALAAGRGERHG
jgi:RNA polymerase sigma-70 factor (ECF subfamily)